MIPRACTPARQRARSRALAGGVAIRSGAPSSHMAHAPARSPSGLVAGEDLAPAVRYSGDGAAVEMSDAGSGEPLFSAGGSSAGGFSAGAERLVAFDSRVSAPSSGNSCREGARRFGAR